MGCDAVGQQLGEQDIQSLRVPDHSSVEQFLQKVSDPQVLCLSRSVIFVGQLVIYVFGPNRNRYHDLSLYLTKLIHEVELATWVDGRPLQNAMVDHLKDCIAHCLELAGVESVRDDLSAGFVGGLCRLCPEE